jgi:hypothetical protein
MRTFASRFGIQNERSDELDASIVCFIASKVFISSLQNPFVFVRWFRWLTTLAMDAQFFSVDICSLYDAIVYLDTTTAARSLPGAGATRPQQ